MAVTNLLMPIFLSFLLISNLDAAMMSFVTRDDVPPGRRDAGIDILVNDVSVGGIPIGKIPNDWAAFTVKIPDDLIVQGIASVKFRMTGSGPNIVIEKFTLDSISVNCGPDDLGNSNGGVEGNWYGCSIRYGTQIEYSNLQSLKVENNKPISFLEVSSSEKVKRISHYIDTVTK